MKVPFLDLKLQLEPIRHEIDHALLNVMENTAFASGPFVQKFEEKFAEFCEAKFCIAVNSGTSALHLALLASDIKPGDEVITVPNSFIATAWAITYCGAKPVFVDVEEGSWLMNPDLIEKAVTSKTKAILPVHLYGQCSNMDKINKIAKKNNLVVIEDAAQAHAGKYNGKTIGSLGNTTCFSFYPGKNLGAFGEGGAVVTDNKDIANKIRMLRDHGQSKKYFHEIIGFNYRMDGFQGAILTAKLKYLQRWTDNRNEISKKYNQQLTGISGLDLPIVDDNVISAFHLYVICVKNRDQMVRYLDEQGISSGLHYPVPIHLQNAYKGLGYKKGDFPISEKNAEKCISLPMFPELTDLQLDYVCKKILNFLT